MLVFLLDYVAVRIHVQQEIRGRLLTAAIVTFLPVRGLTNLDE